MTDKYLSFLPSPVMNVLLVAMLVVALATVQGKPMPQQFKGRELCTTEIDENGMPRAVCQPMSEYQVAQDFMEMVFSQYVEGNMRSEEVGDKSLRRRLSRFY